MKCAADMYKTTFQNDGFFWSEHNIFILWHRDLINAYECGCMRLPSLCLFLAVPCVFSFSTGSAHFFVVPFRCCSSFSKSALAVIIFSVSYFPIVMVVNFTNSKKPKWFMLTFPIVVFVNHTIFINSFHTTDGNHFRILYRPNTTVECLCNSKHDKNQL